VERGIRSVDRLSVLLDMAKILHVDVESLTRISALVIRRNPVGRNACQP
jgi:hypothetical protein